MLISDIDRNRATEPDKQLERVSSSGRSLTVSGKEEHQPFERHLHGKRGVVLRRGGRRHGQRRRQYSAGGFPHEADRRHCSERRMVSRWNPADYDILVVAVRKYPNDQHVWKIGEEIRVDPVTSQAGTGNHPTQPNPTRKESSASSEADSDKDYVVHLSRDEGKGK